MLIVGSVAAGGACGSSTSEPSYTDPHETGFVTLPSGVRLHYLDFGGSGEVLSFLAAAGNTAHVFDNFAPRFMDRFHVLAVTRSGFGESSQSRVGLRYADAGTTFTNS